MLNPKFAIAAALVLTAAPALAEAPTRAVSYADLDLSQPAGRARLERRLSAAIRKVCGNAYPVDLLSVHDVRTCRVETAAQVAADRRIGQVSVSQLSGAY